MTSLNAPMAQGSHQNKPTQTFDELNVPTEEKPQAVPAKKPAKKDTTKFVCPSDSDEDEDLPLQAWQIAILTDRVETRRNYSLPPPFTQQVPAQYRYCDGPCYCLSQAPR